MRLMGKQLEQLRAHDAREAAKVERAARRQEREARKLVGKDGKVNVERFWSMVAPQGECLVWTGPTKSNHPDRDDIKSYQVGVLDRGEGHFRQTHRVAVELALSMPRIDPSIDIAQVCGNHLCCNLDHMVVREHCGKDRIANQMPVREFFAAEYERAKGHAALEAEADKLLEKAA